MHFASLAQAIQNDQTGKGCRYLCPMCCEANSRSSLARLSRYDFKLTLSLQSSLAKLSRTEPSNSQYRKAIAFNGKIILLLCCRGITLGRAATQAFGSPSPGHPNRCCMPVPSISKRSQILSSQTRTRRIQSLTLHSHCSDSQPRYLATNSKSHKLTTCKRKITPYFVVQEVLWVCAATNAVRCPRPGNSSWSFRAKLCWISVASTLKRNQDHREPSSPGRSSRTHNIIAILPSQAFPQRTQRLTSSPITFKSKIIL